MIPRSSYLRVGESLAKDSNQLFDIIQLFVDNGYSREFIIDILELLTTKDINRIAKNIPELKTKLETSCEDIIYWLTKN
jgi:hypothetical protein